MFNCVFDWCSLWNGFFLGVVSSIIASVLTNWYIRRETRKRFSAALGDYIGWGFIDESANPLVKKSEAQSKAKVSYKKRNILRIEVKHNDRTWDGDIAMEHETYGTVVWKYIDTQEDEHSFGFKRMMVREEEKKVYLYFVGESPFGKEMFVRDK